MQGASSLRLGRRVGVTAREDVPLPVECYLSCNIAYRTAEDVGETDASCPEDSEFMTNYNICYSCLMAKSRDFKLSVKEYLEPTFSRYISYCQAKTASAIDPTWYTTTEILVRATYTNKDGPTEPAVALAYTTVLRSDWTGFMTSTSSSASPAATSITDSSSGNGSSNSLAPWVWAIIGAVVALGIIGLGILLFLYKRGKLSFLKRKGKSGKTTSGHELDGDSAWRSGDKPELHGETAVAAPTEKQINELYTESGTEPRELDSSVRPVELAVGDGGMRPEVFELPAEYNYGGGEVVENGNANQTKGGPGETRQ
ncbi:hypothetical protein B0T20DRAFT_246481 [Sordaria brevicollis]|uniref:Uncharacterized protein n=1 Tax=Sordaria brevicollis TaxID=83679 RepID=A0AAE0PBN5_SORBR|nr:hypothetical protein B0T20DRAFT_246481 [Sordaria brevicollis]